MNEGKEKMTAEEVSVGADTRQSPLSTADIIADYNGFCNTDEEEFFIDPRKFDPRYIETVTMQGLLDTAFTPRMPIIEGLLYPGTYLMAGAPKIGKSFLVLQMGFAIATGTPLWEMPVRQGSVLYLALEDDYARLQRMISRMFDVEGTENMHFATRAKSVENGLMQQLEGFIREHNDTRLIIFDTLQKVRGENEELENENRRLEERLASLEEKNDDLHKQTRDYALLRGVFGDEYVDSLVTEAREKQHNYEQNRKENHYEHQH